MRKVEQTAPPGTSDNQEVCEKGTPERLGAVLETQTAPGRQRALSGTDTSVCYAVVPAQPPVLLHPVRRSEELSTQTQTPAALARWKKPPELHVPEEGSSKALPEGALGVSNASRQEEAEGGAVPTVLPLLQASGTDAAKGLGSKAQSIYRPEQAGPAGAPAPPPAGSAPPAHRTPVTCAAGGRHRRDPPRGHPDAVRTRLRRGRRPAAPLVPLVHAVGVSIAEPLPGEADGAGLALELARGAAGQGPCGGDGGEGDQGPPAPPAPLAEGSPRAGRTRASANESEGRVRGANRHIRDTVCLHAHAAGPAPPPRSPFSDGGAGSGSTGRSSGSTGKRSGSTGSRAMPRAPPAGHAAATLHRWPRSGRAHAHG